MSKSLALQPLQTARHRSVFSFSKQHTTVSFATRAASTSVLGKGGESREGITGEGITGKGITGKDITRKGITGKGIHSRERHYVEEQLCKRSTGS